ncbi:MAG TPA: histidine kinase [Chitinophagaceae bacterium]|nr:histidine kinase [Chitinophagaceae bacterium]
MILSPTAANEQERLMELLRYEVLYTQYEEDFDQIVQLASSICKTPISTITLLDAHKQWFKAKIGIENTDGDRDTSFCGHAIHQSDIMEVEDALIDERFSDNPLVLGDPKIRFYAGCPLVSPEGYALGTLCVIDNVPRSLTEEQKLTLRILGNQVMKLFELRLKNKEALIRSQLIEEQKRKLEESKTIQHKIISIIAHDVRGPVASVKAMIELTKESGLSEEETAELLGLLDKQLDGTLDMLTNLVEWGSILLQKEKPDIGQVAVAALADKIISNLQPFASAKNNTIVNLVNVNCRVQADENTLRFIIRNIISNANKFTSSGTIAITCETMDEQKIRISIADTGCGMTDEILQQLFNPAKRQSREGAHKEKGSGLGLILAKEFAEAMQISMSVISEQDKGTSFHLTLQAA